MVCALLAPLLSAVVFCVFWISSYLLPPRQAQALPTSFLGRGPDTSELTAELSAYPNETEIQQWAKHWQDSSADNWPNSDFELDQVQEALSKSSITADDRLRIAAMLDAAGDSNSSAIWARSGVVKADAELSKLPADSQQGLAIRQELVPLEATLSRQQDPPTLERFWALQIPIPRNGISDNKPEWRQISHAGWLVYEGKFAKAIEEIESQRADSGNHPLDSEQQSESTWVEGLARYRGGDIANARPLLEQVANGHSYHIWEAGFLVHEIDRPKTVLGILQAHKPEIPVLEDWARKWQAVSATSRPADQDTQALSTIITQITLSNNPLSATEKLEIARTVGDSGDISTALVWVSSGVAAAEAELVPLKCNDLSAQPLLYELKATLDRFTQSTAQSHYNRPDWDISAHVEIGEDLSGQITDLLMRFDPTDTWDQRAAWARDGHMDSMFSSMPLGDDPTMAELLKQTRLLLRAASNPDSHYTEDQRTELHYFMALSLMRMHRYAEALPHVEHLAAIPNYRHRARVVKWRVYLLAYLKQEKPALRAALEYIDEQKLDPQASYVLIRQVQAALKGQIY